MPFTEQVAAPTVPALLLGTQLTPVAGFAPVFAQVSVTFGTTTPGPSTVGTLLTVALSIVVVSTTFTVAVAVAQAAGVVAGSAQI